MLNFIVFCGILLLAGIPATLVFAFVMMGAAAPLMALGERVPPVLRVPLVGFLFLAQAYFWGAWAAFAVALTARFSAKPEVTWDWLYWIVGFCLCVSLVGYFAMRENSANRARGEGPPSTRGVCLYWFLCAAFFVLFAFWPAAMTLPYGWLVGVLGLEVPQGRLGAGETAP